MSKNKIVAIIPARGGSKRVPMKNIIDFKGKPMIAWTIEAALKSGLFDDVYVSTDSEEIAQVSIKYGAKVPVLRNHFSDDFSPVSEATLQTILQLEELGMHYDEVVQLFAVCPLRNHEDIINAYQFFTERNADFLISCNKFAWMNPWWALKLNENFNGEWIFEDTKIRSQDLPELYCPTGAVWISRIEELKKSKTFYGPDHIFWEIPWQRALDIDNYDDIKLGLALSELS